MNAEQIKIYDSGYNEGFFRAIEVLASMHLRTISNHHTMLLECDKRVLSAELRLTAKRILQKRGLVPWDHDVTTGKKEPVNINFDVKEY